KPPSLQRDRAIWAEECIEWWLRGPISWCHTVPSVQIARSRTRDLISASLALRKLEVALFVGVELDLDCLDLCEAAVHVGFHTVDLNLLVRDILIEQIGGLAFVGERSGL